MIPRLSPLGRCYIAAAFGWLVAPLSAAGCGDSDSSAAPPIAAESAGQGGGPGAGAEPSGGSPSSSGGDGALPGLPMLDGGAQACVDCVTDNCPAAQTCFEDPACVQGAACALATCVAQDGGDGLDCWLGCFEDDPAAALTAFSAFTCVAGSCGMDCTAM